MRVLVTRPEGQADSVMQALQAQGHTPIHQPALAIMPCAETPRMRAVLTQLDAYYAVIFISPSAAQLALDKMAHWWPQWPVGVHWLAVGEGTARGVRDAGLVPLCPDSRADSEGLLALPVLKQLSEKRILLCKGEGGRPLLEQALKQRGADVDTLLLYKRVCAPVFLWPEPPVDALLVTSSEGWRCIDTARRSATTTASPLVIVAGSDRIAAAVSQSLEQPHWQQARVVVAQSPVDEHMLAALQQATRLTEQ